jgi:hypothetical protein
MMYCFVACAAIGTNCSENIIPLLLFTGRCLVTAGCCDSTVLALSIYLSISDSFPYSVTSQERNPELRDRGCDHVQWWNDYWQGKTEDTRRKPCYYARSSTANLLGEVQLVLYVQARNTVQPCCMYVANQKWTRRMCFILHTLP